MAFNATEIGYGAWTLCNDHLTAESTIFSFGVGSDVSFEGALARRFGARIWSFDPTISQTYYEKRLALQNLNQSSRSRLHFMPYGLGTVDAALTFYVPKSQLAARMIGVVGMSLSTEALPGYVHVLNAPVFAIETLQMLSRVQHVDVVKMDIEGVEIRLFNSEAFRKWLFGGNGPEQIAIEFHDRLMAGAQAPAKPTKAQAKARALTRSHQLRLPVYRMLRAGGFERRHQSANAEEVLFVRTSRPTPHRS